MKKTALLLLTAAVSATAADHRFFPEKDDSGQYLFSVEHPDKSAEITVSPKVFRIEAGKTYYINHSDNGGPFRVTAKKDGVLSFRRPPEIRNTFCITENLPNLIANPADFDISKKKPAVSLRKIIASVPVEAGKRYRGSFFFAQLSGNQDSAIALEMRLKCNKKRILHVNNRYMYSFPLLKGTLDSPRYCMEEITVPKHPGKYELEIGVELSAAPGSFRISRIELTQAPPRLWHRGKYSKGTLYGNIPNAEKLMSKRKAVSSEIKTVNGIPRLFCNGKISTFLPIQAGSEEQIKAAYAAGFRIMMVTLPINNWGNKQGSVWVEKNKYDWSPLDKKLAGMAELAPEAKIILLCYGLAYPGFAEEHPDSMWIDSSGRKGLKFCSSVPETAYSLSGRETGDICGRFLRTLGEHLRKSPLGKNVIMLHLSAGSDGQWYQPQRPWNYKKLDYSNATRLAVIEQIKKFYNGNIRLLQKAWGMPCTAFENLTAPSEKELQCKDFLLDIKNPRHRRLIDWIKADQKALIENIDHLAGEFKKGFGRKVLVSTYSPYNRFPDKTSLFRTKNLDVFVYLSSYFRPRGSGGDSGCFYPNASAVLHNKFLLEEVDYRNEYFGYNGTNRYAQVSMADNHENYLALLLRAFGVNWSRGTSGWFRPINGDSYLAWTGPYQKHLEVIKKAAELALKFQRSESSSDILLFIGDDYQNQLSRKNNFDHMMDYVSTNRINLPSSGLSNQIYLLSDLENPARTKGKIHIFAGAASISPRQVDHICKNLQKDNNVLIFMNDIGRNNPMGFSRTLKKLSGIDGRLFPDKMVQGIYSSKTVNPFSIRDIPCMSVWVRSILLPEVVITPSGTERIANLPSGLPGAVVKRHKNWTAIYIAGTAKNVMSRGFWATAAQLAKITPALPAGDVGYSGNGVSVIHAVTDGIKTLAVPPRTDLIDAVTGKKIPVKNGKADFPMKYGETRLLLKTKR